MIADRVHELGNDTHHCGDLGVRYVEFKVVLGLNACGFEVKEEIERSESISNTCIDALAMESMVP